MGRFDKAIKPNFGSKDMAQVWSADNMIQKLLDVEVALAKVECSLGIVPKEAYEEIERKGKFENLDPELYEKTLAVAGHSLVTLIRCFQAVCENGAGQYIHWGATSQDIMDTGQILQIREGLDIVYNKTKKLRGILAGQAEKYRDTVMMGRTHGQHALPLTLGFKFAIWIDELDRCIERIDGARARILAHEFFGAVGTLSALKPEEGRAVSKGLAEELGLTCAKISWHVTRDRYTEYAVLLGFVCGALRRIAGEIFDLMRTDIDEVCEGYTPGKVGSSTMPQKRNPHTTQRIATFARIGCLMVNEAFDCLENAQERDLRRMLQEEQYLPRISCATDAALDAAIKVCSNLEIKEYNMQRNIELQHGLVFSEAIMMELAPHIGRHGGHEKVYELAMAALDTKTPFRELLLKDEVVRKYITPERLEEIMNPANYIGQAPEFVDIILGKLEF